MRMLLHPSWCTLFSTVSRMSFFFRFSILPEFLFSLSPQSCSNPVPLSCRVAHWILILGSAHSLPLSCYFLHSAQNRILIMNCYNKTHPPQMFNCKTQKKKALLTLSHVQTGLIQATNYHTGPASLNTGANVQGCNYYTCEHKGNKTLAYTDSTYLYYINTKVKELCCHYVQKCS